MAEGSGLAKHPEYYGHRSKYIVATFLFHNSYFIVTLIRILHDGEYVFCFFSSAWDETTRRRSQAKRYKNL